jgi:TonB family protein
MVCEGWEGNTVDGKFPLLEWLRGWADRCVFLTVRQGAQKANIKLVVASGPVADAQLRSWEAAKSLYHPFLVQLMEMGRSTVHESDVVYLVTEKTDTFLSGIIPRKALGPSEVRVILEPILDALSFLHGKGLAHGNVKPSNIVQVGEQWKLGSDEMGSGDLANAARKPDGYDAPEIAEGRLTPAADMWSLGIIMVEAFAQRTPVWDREAKADLGVPVWVMPEPFREIARGCLRWEPADRTSIEEAKASLARYTPSADVTAPVAAEVVPEPHADQKKDLRAVAAEPPFRAEPEPVEFAPRSRLFNLEEEEHTGRKGSFGVAILVLLAVVAVLAIRFRGRLFPSHEPQNTPAESQTAQPKPQAPQSEPGSEQSPAANPDQPAPGAAQTPAPNSPTPTPVQEGATTSQSAPANQSAAATTQPAPTATKPQEVAPEQPKSPPATKPETAPAESSDEAVTKPLANSKGAVVKRVLPNVGPEATGSMRRPMDVELRVSVNEEGRVANVQYMTLGPGNYFARKAHQAAEGWKFKPPHSNGQAVASKWVLLFRFERGRTDVTATEIH